jgi:hypothetical protein
MSSAIPRVTATNSVLVVVDVQDKLLALISQTPTLLLNLSFLFVIFASRSPLMPWPLVSQSITKQPSDG